MRNRILLGLSTKKRYSPGETLKFCLSVSSTDKTKKPRPQALVPKHSILIRLEFRGLAVELLLGVRGTVEYLSMREALLRCAGRSNFRHFSRTVV